MSAILLALVNGLAPEFIALVKEKFAKDNPGAPGPTDEQVHAAMLNWLAGTLAKDDAFLAGD
jgi:hypothetical protein